MTSERPPSYRFGPFLLDMARRQLSRAGDLVPLRPKDLEVLALLLSNADRAVSKDELLKSVWPDAVVDENNLPRHISTLRRVRGDAAGTEAYIETVPGWGYRFTAAVERVAGEATTPSPAPAAPEHAGSAGLEADPEVLPPPRAATKPSWFRRPAALALALIVSLVVMGGVYRVSRMSPPALAMRELRQVTYQPGHQESPTWSPDGRSLALTSDQSGSFDIYVQSLSGSEMTRLTTSPDHDWQPSWSPDGLRIAFRSERDGGGIYLVGSNGGDERRLADFGYQPRWSPDGTRILLSTGLADQGETSRLFLVDVADGTSRAFSSERLAGYQVLAANWHPHGQQISLWASSATQGRTFATVRVSDGSMFAAPVAEEVAKRIEALGLVLRRFVWAPSGRFLYFEGVAANVGSVWRIGVDPDTQTWISGPDRLTTGAGRDTGISLSADGTKLAFGIVSSRKQLWTLPFDSVAGVVRGSGEPLDLGAEEPVNASLDVDGRRLVYRTVRAGRHEIRERSVIDGQEQILMVGTTTPPHLSRDGTRLAYARTVSAGTGPTASSVVVLTIGGEERPIARFDGRMRWSLTDWAPDGSALLGTCSDATPDAVNRVCLMPLSAAPAAENQLQILAAHATHNLFVPRFSPDMRWISFIASNAGRSTVYIMPARGGPWIQLTDSRFQNDKLRWAPDSRAVYFVSNRSAFLNVWKRQIDAAGQPVGPLTQVTHFNSTKRMIPSSLAGMEFAITSDRFFLPLTEASSRIWLLGNVDK